MVVEGTILFKCSDLEAAILTMDNHFIEGSAPIPLLAPDVQMPRAVEQDCFQGKVWAGISCVWTAP